MLYKYKDAVNYSLSADQYSLVEMKKTRLYILKFTYDEKELTGVCLFHLIMKSQCDTGLVWLCSSLPPCNYDLVS